jgi:hypothetical protein
LILATYWQVFGHQVFGTGLATTVVRREDESVKIEIPFLAALVLIGTSLLARMEAQDVEQALFSTAKSKRRSGDS